MIYKKYNQKTAENILLISILLVFTIFASYVAVRLERGIIPDETTHFILSQQFATTWGIPPDTSATYAIGPLGHSPYFYYWINGRVLNLLNLFIPSPTPWKEVVVLRLLNVVYSILTLIFAYLLAKEIIKKRWWQLLVVFLLANTMMFVFLSGGVNYDNLTNLCCMASIYFLVRVFNNKPFYENSLLWLIFICLGALVKITILPLAVIMFITWAFYVGLNRKKIQFHPVWNRKMVSFVVILVVLVAFNLSLYGVNLVRYKAISPVCTQILTVEQCNLSAFVERAKQLYLPEKLTIVGVVQNGYPDPVEYVLDFWTASMMKMIYGFMGHKSYLPDLIITFYRIFYLWVIFAMVRWWKKPPFAIGGMLFLAFCYTLVLLNVNYDSEMITGFKHVAVQGRYIFPVIGIIYSLVVYYLSELENLILRRVSYAAAVILFLIGCPLMFITHYSTAFIDWFYPL